MIVSRTPFRVSFLGGGTDYHAWFKDHGGTVLASTIKYYSYITCRYLPRFYSHKSRIVWSKIELVENHRDIEHPVVRAALEHLQVTEGVEIHHHSDLPAYSGLGSSSAFVVGLLKALDALQNSAGTAAKGELARRAVDFEQDVLREPCGVQDPIQISYGGLNRIDIGRNGNFEVTPIPVSAEKQKRLEASLTLVFLKRQRVSAPFARATIKSIPKRRRQLTRLMGLVDDGVNILSNGADNVALGELLHENWRLKREIDDSISAPEIDDVYERGRRAGAIGGKLLGAGGGGFMMFCSRPEDRDKIVAALGELPCLPVRFENGGATVFAAEDLDAD